MKFTLSLLLGHSRSKQSVARAEDEEGGSPGRGRKL